MGRRGGSTMFMSVIFVALLYLPVALSYHHSPPADAIPTINVDSLFQYTASRNQKVITQAVDIVISMQTAPTCTRMAASHLMNECKLLENAPDFAKARPEAYLDNVKTEYAAKLAVCELLSAQPGNPVAPPHCDILVPSSRACGKGKSWWYSKAEVASDKQCYPEFKDSQYVQCLKSLQSTPQFWTSFSNARQNAVVMCQASRDAIERENHLETFKNLTGVLGVVTSTMQKTNEDYESLIREQKKSAEEARDSNHRFQEEIHAVQEKAVATVGALDERFHKFMENSMSELISTLADSQSAEIVQIKQRMQQFSQDLILESSQTAKFFTDKLQQFHQASLSTLHTYHDAQVSSSNILSGNLHGLHHIVNQTRNDADITRATINTTSQMIDTMEGQVKNLARGVAFLSALPDLVAWAVRGAIATTGIMFIFAVLFKCSTKLAALVTGACSSAFLLHICGLFEWLTNLPSQVTNVHAQRSFSIIAFLSPSQQGAAIVLLVWLSAYPITRLNSYISYLISVASERLFRPLWVRQYLNEGGTVLLPSIEVPSDIQYRKFDASIDREIANRASRPL